MIKTLILFFLLLPAFLWAQNQSVSIDQLYALNSMSQVATPTASIAKGFYKKYLSVQFSASCQFTSSCSVFMHNATSKFGFIKGTLLGIDRLTRCGLAESSYSYLPSLINTQSGLFIDAVYHYEKK